jgi:hypothetical protein
LNFFAQTEITISIDLSKTFRFAVFGNIRIGVNAPWTQKRRIVSYKKFIVKWYHSNVFLNYQQIGLLKSPVEGSTAALVRLQSPVVYSDFVRPICLPDDDFSKNSIVTDYPSNSALSSANLISSERPHAEKFFGKLKKKTFEEDRQFFQLSGM